METRIRLAGLFAGIGGLDRGIQEGLESCGMTVEHTALVEMAEFPREVLAARFPEAELFEDVQTVHGADLKADVIVGGFPCQDISGAKQGAEGLAGARSGLWREQRRIIEEAQCAYAVIENVSALLRKGLWKVLTDLHEAGYVSQYDLLTAHSVGAPHQRERIFIIAQHPSVYSGKLLKLKPQHTDDWARPYPEPWTASRSEETLAAVKALGNAVLPPVAAVVGEALGMLGTEYLTESDGPGEELSEATRMPRAGFVGRDGLLRALPSATTRLRPSARLSEQDLTGSRADRARELDARIRARRLPTPTASDWKGGGVGGAWYRNLKQGMGGLPSPQFLEWVMGFPTNWTDV